MAEWIIKEKAATELTNIVSKLRFENSTELVLFRNKLVDQNISEVLNLHIYAREFVKQNITIRETLPIAQKQEERAHPNLIVIQHLPLMT